jgi:beta-lactam-binding protein with PASTA domain
MSAAGRLLMVIALLGAFLAGLFGVVIFSLRGEEVQVPEIVGKDFVQSEKELAALGLKIKKRATRYSQETPNTVLEQLPRPGDTVKTGQLILVVVSRAYTEGDETPVQVEKETNEEQTVTNDNEPVNTSLTKKDKPKKEVKANSNANTNIANKGIQNANSGGEGDNKNSGTGNSNNSNAKNTNSNNTNKNNNNRTAPANTAKPQAGKTPAATGDTRTRRVP